MKKQHVNRLDSFQVNSLSPKEATKIKGGFIGVEDLVDG